MTPTISYVLWGGDGHDHLNNGEGNGFLDSGEGADSLTGGDGFDTFVAGNGDLITDFNNATGGVLNDGDTTNNDFIGLSVY